ncbi:hypothetical protein EV360DRAFT_89665 [Lentinula raphanica]|nr:hypothetical protein EV360DRAFT_89665 [Lentinula raphanica]
MSKTPRPRTVLKSYLVALPLVSADGIPRGLPRFIHHLGPRYFGSIQDTDIVRFKTYTAVTLLNIFVLNAGAITMSNSSRTSSFGGGS